MHDRIAVMDAKSPYRPTSSQPPQPQQRVFKTGTWLPAEDASLRAAVDRHGTRWVSVARDVGSRNGDQCAKRWNEKLNPKLDHSAWSLEEEENLLHFVHLYGHNWKFIADNFLETRAPLALKNRYTLLIRRAKRPKSRPQNPLRRGSYQDAASAAAAIHPLFHPLDAAAASSSSGSSTPSSGLSAIHSPGFLAGDASPLIPPLSDHGTSTRIPYSRLDPPTTTNTAGTAINPGIAAPSWVVDQSLIWPHSSFDNPRDQIEPRFDINGGNDPGTEIGNSSMMPESCARSLWADDGIMGTGRSVSSALPGSVDREMGTAAAAVEYSVTCQRGKLRTVVNYLVDAAMSESAEGSETEDPVTLTLQLNARRL